MHAAVEAIRTLTGSDAGEAMKITAAVVERAGAPFVLQELELGELRDDEVLVKNAASGICHTDLICRDQLYPVPLPAVLGHEGAGVVEAVGRSVTAFAPGDRVGMSYDSCGHCPTCSKALGVYCHAFFEHNFAASRPADGSSALSRDGEAVHAHFFGQSSFATHSVARERNIVALDDAIPFDVAAPFGCGIQTGAGAVLNVMRPPAGSSIAVFGAGAVGLAAVMAAQIAGCTTIIAIDIRPNRLELCAGGGGDPRRRLVPDRRRGGDSRPDRQRRRLLPRGDGRDGRAAHGRRLPHADGRVRRRRGAGVRRRGRARRQHDPHRRARRSRHRRGRERPVRVPATARRALARGQVPRGPHDDVLASQMAKEKKSRPEQ